MSKLLGVLALAVWLAALPSGAGARTRAASVKIAVPAPGGVAVALGTVKGTVARVTVARAPRGVLVTGGARKGLVAIAVAAPRQPGARGAAAGSVLVRVTGRRAQPRLGALTVAASAVLAPPARPAACANGPALGALLDRALRGRSSGLGAPLAT